MVFWENLFLIIICILFIYWVWFRIDNDLVIIVKYSNFIRSFCKFVVGLWGILVFMLWFVLIIWVLIIFICKRLILLFFI